MDFTKPAKGFAWATKYKKNEIGLFPSKFKNFDVNDLPLEKINHYYWAENGEIVSFTKHEGHSGFKIANPTPKKLKAHMICLSHADVSYDKNYKEFSHKKSMEIFLDTLSKCRFFHHISMK